MRRPSHGSRDTDMQERSMPRSSSSAMMLSPHPVYFSDTNNTNVELFRKSPYRHSRNTSRSSFLGPSPSSTTAVAGYGPISSDPFTPTRDDSSRATSHLNTRSSDESAASVAGATRAAPPSTLHGGPDGGPDHPRKAGPAAHMAVVRARPWTSGRAAPRACSDPSSHRSSAASRATSC